MKQVSVFALVMLMTGAVDGVSNLPSIALFGINLIFFFIAAALLFLIPTGLISAELCKQTHDEGGVYAWTKLILGKHAGTAVIWLQWINTMVWFPTCLTTLVGTFAYLIDPNLAHHPWYLVGASVSIFWIMTFVNLKGLQHSTRIAALATVLGMVIPMIIIIVLSMLWIILGKPLALTLHASAIVPDLSQSHNWTSLTAIIAAFLGVELATVHVNKVKDAKHIFPKALTYSIMLILVTMGLGSLGVALVIPHAEIVLVTGTINAFNALFHGFNVGWLEPILGGMLIFSSLGTIVNWLISPAQGFARAAADGFLPKALSKENQHGVAQNMLFLQAVVVTVISSAFFLMPSINGSYWFLLDLSTELYVMMYAFMFIVALIFFVKYKTILVIPGKIYGACVLAVAGLLGCLITLTVGFFPPAGINVGGDLHYILNFGGGLLLLLLPLPLFYIYHWKQQSK